MAKRRNRNALVSVTKRPRDNALSGVDNGRGGSWMTIFSGGGDYDPGWWQKDKHFGYADANHNWTVFACQTLIAGDVSKLRLALVEKVNEVWQETDSPAYGGFLRRPNEFQTWQQFVEYWILCKVSRGNAYVLLDRDLSTRVRAAYVLDPDRVTPLVADNGDVFYRLATDDLARVPEGDVVIPASEIMHDRYNCLYHPLIGLSPLFASAPAAIQGLVIQSASSQFFRNGSRPSGLLVTAQHLPDATASEYKKRWEENYGGTRGGGTAVLGSGLEYKPIAMSAVDSELVKQLNLTAEMICSTYHVPAYKVGVGATPTYQNAEILNQIYYDACLQKLIEGIESQIELGLELDNVGGRKLRARFDLDGLLRMDNRTQISAIAEAVKAGVMAPNEGRRRISLPPVPGGDTPYLQEQNYSLAALDKRDTQDDPFAPATPAAAPATPPAAANDDNAAEEALKELAARFSKGMEDAAA